MGCAPFKGNHKSVAFSKELDKIVEEIPGPLPNEARVAVIDSGTNIKAAMPKSSQTLKKWFSCCQYWKKSKTLQKLSHPTF